MLCFRVLVCSFNWVYVNPAWRNGWWHTRWGYCWVEVQAHWRMGCCSDSRWHWACCICHVGRNPPAWLPKSPLEATGLSTLSEITFYIAVLLHHSFFTSALWNFSQVPYIPASRAQVQNVMTLLRGRQGGLVDLGSGDGRIVSINNIFGLLFYFHW